ncbi:MAG: Coenzyme F420 hydrogenase/dehydrogenase, beta subunit C-terminal domain [Desulfobacterales bacterium]|jgi:coenzyme F420 hydrogenase subunit beta|nr:Coenzyme F420 hydrogenase/dehydrogenase, beta subunit C-terminal domain [Desulfobacterales bacterium]
MKTFFNLIQDVQKPGLCHRCGGCVTFCSAVNYGALELDPDGKPRYGAIEKCIECGLCHAICPEIDELETETREQAGWVAPIGRVIETTVARAGDPAVRRNATDGGVVTALLVHLLERGRIDGAIVTKQVGPFQRRPALATSSEEIKDAAGFFFDTSHGMKSFGDQYLLYSSIEEFDPMIKKGLRRVALVGTPCQIKSVRRMQTLGLVPSESVQLCLGLFCSGNFTFGEDQRRGLAAAGGFSWEDVRKVNIKDDFLVHLKSGEVKSIALDDLQSVRRYACRFCSDYAAEFADIAFGGIGAEEGWTTVLIRSPLGRAAFADAKGAAMLEEFSVKMNPNFATQALAKVRSWSTKKRQAAQQNRRQLGSKAVQVKG